MRFARLLVEVVALQFARLLEVLARVLLCGLLGYLRWLLG